jgi:hypothetical protein
VRMRLIQLALPCSPLFPLPPSLPPLSFPCLNQSTQVVKLKEELAAPLRVMQENARRIAKVCRESKLPVVEEEYVQQFKVELMDAVMQWCRGAKFADVCKMTDVYVFFFLFPPLPSFLRSRLRPVC